MKSKHIFIAVCFFYLIGHPLYAAAQEHDHRENHKDRGHREHGSHQEHSEEVHLKAESQKMIGLEIIQAKKMPLLSSIEVIGEISQDSENTVHITSEESGILEEVKVSLGDVVSKGTPLCVIKTKEGALQEIVSPAAGIVMAQYLKAGDSVDEISSIMTIVDPSVMKASFNLYEKDLAGVQLGQKINVKTLAYPNREFSGEAVYIAPQVDSKTRTIKIRVDIHNEERLLKFGMYVTGEILVSLSEAALVLPEEAIEKIEEEFVVFIPQKNEAEGFLVREVTLGRKAGGLVEILEGITEGERVVGKGSFYLKAEMQKGGLEHGHAH